MTGKNYNEWAIPTNAFVSDDSHSVGLDLYKQDYSTFSFSIPSDATINGVKVDVECQGDVAYAVLQVYVSTCGGGAYNPARWSSPYALTIGDTLATDLTYTFGGALLLWGLPWVPDALSDQNFRVYVEAVICTGCSLLKGSLLLGADGAYRPVETFKAGDEVLSYDTDKKKFFKNKIEKFEVHPSSRIYVINDQARVTGTELVYADQKGNGQYSWTLVSKLKTGDFILKEKNRTEAVRTKVERIDVLDMECDVYSVHTEKPYNNYWVDQYLFDMPDMISIDQVLVTVYYTPASSTQTGGPEPAKLMRHGGNSEGGKRKKFTW